MFCGRYSLWPILIFHVADMVFGMVFLEIVNSIHNKCDGKTRGGCHRIGEELIIGVYRLHGVWPMDGSTK